MKLSYLGMLNIAVLTGFGSSVPGITRPMDPLDLFTLAPAAAITAYLYSIGS